MRACEIAKAAGGRLFGKEAAEAKGVSTDSRRCKAGDLFVAIRGENMDGNRFLAGAYKNGAAVAIGEVEMTPPDGCAYIQVPDSVQALGLLGAWHRGKFSMPVVGVTGSVGKTTTKEMIAAVLSTAYKTKWTRGNFNNAIGLPLTLLSIPEDCEAAVIEMGMSARGEISYLTNLTRPTIAVITNVGLSHIENLGSQENIYRAKLEIAEGLPAGSTLLVNGDDPFLENTTLSEVQVKRFGLDNPACEYRANLCGENAFCIEDRTYSLPISGRHNVYNALAAYAVGKELGMQEEKIQAGLLSYKTDGIRQSEVEFRPGITAICDYYNASPASMSVALGMLEKGEGRRRIAVLGDMLELGEFGEKCHREVGKEAVARGVDMLLAVGTLSRYAVEEARKAGIAYAESFPDNQSLAAYLLKTIQAGDRILIKGSHGMRMGEIFEAIK